MKKTHSDKNQKDCTSIIIKGVITAGTVIDAVAKVTGVSRKRILSGSRLWPVVESRMISVLVFNSLGLVDIKIAYLLKRGRSSVCKSRHTAQNLLEYSKTFQDKFGKVQSIINNINPQ